MTIDMVNSPKPCLPWDKARLPSGYGYFYEGSKLVYAHRRALENVIGKIPHGMCVMHTCDNPWCVEDSHLRLGSHSDNMRDAYAKGRLIPPVNNKQSGEKNKMCKLTDMQVEAIRLDTRVQEEIARDYGIRQSHVSRIKRGLCRKSS